MLWIRQVIDRAGMIIGCEPDPYPGDDLLFFSEKYTFIRKESPGKLIGKTIIEKPYVVNCHIIKISFLNLFVYLNEKSFNFSIADFKKRMHTY